MGQNSNRKAMESFLRLIGIIMEDKTIMTTWIKALALEQTNYALKTKTFWMRLFNWRKNRLLKRRLIAHQGWVCAQMRGYRRGMILAANCLSAYVLSFLHLAGVESDQRFQPVLAAAKEVQSILNAPFLPRREDSLLGVELLTLENLKESTIDDTEWIDRFNVCLQGLRDRAEEYAVNALHMELKK